MNSISRSPLWGLAKKILVIILLLITIIIFVCAKNKYTELKRFNNVLSFTVNEQTSTIQNLQSKNDELNTSITLLEEENAKLQLEIQEMSKMLISSNVNMRGSFKSYTDYRRLSKNSLQWKLQEQAYTDKNGLRKIEDAYLVALGSYYGTTLGTKYKVALSSGNTFYIILCDCKKDSDTDAANRVTISDGSMLEFYVDTKVLPKRVKTSGTIGTLDFFAGDVVSIVKVK